MPDLIDYPFLSEREGGARLVGYVPAAAVSRSGVTIATGFDLGQRNKADLNALALPLTLVDKFLPYLGATGAAAEQRLKDAPLRISLLEANQIDKAVKQRLVETLAARYRTSGHNARGIGFFSLPAQAQTVIASVSFQYGNLGVATPRFWKAASSQDWEGAASELRSFGDDYPTRRRLEAELLAQIVDKKVAETVQ